MRRGALGLLLIAGCGGADHPALHVDAVVNGGSIYVHAIEVARPDATNQQPFAHPGECDETSDGWSCDGACPAAWLGELRLELDGELLADAVYDPPWGSGLSAGDQIPPGAVLILEDLDGAEVEVPLPEVTVPVPTIDEAIHDGDELAVTWHAEPEAVSAVVEYGGGFGGPRCHVTGETATLDIGTSDSGDVSVRAFAAPSLVETAFGDVEVWTGRYVSEPLAGTP